MINTNYKIKKYDSHIFIQDFLDEKTSESLYEKILNVPKDWWHNTLFPTLQGIENIRDSESNNLEIQEKRKKILDNFNSGGFSYCFKRSVGDHYETCFCGCCEVLRFFNTDEMKFKFSTLVGENVTKMNETFCSKYEHGDYLSIHHDQKKGDYAFVYQLTKNWNPIYGGILNFWNSKKNKISHA